YIYIYTGVCSFPSCLNETCRECLLPDKKSHPVSRLAKMSSSDTETRHPQLDMDYQPGPGTVCPPTSSEGWGGGDKGFSSHCQPSEGCSEGWRWEEKPFFPPPAPQAPGTGGLCCRPPAF
uniref:Uncharacterized protein n=1 Tax=Podarcis muralis TaxID=64176 RepID=A0A670HRI5_PODMU